MATSTPKSQSSLKHITMNPPSSSIRVVLRVRPFIPSELEPNNKNPTPCITLLEDHDQGEEVAVQLQDQRTSRNECYKLDSFFGQGDRVDKIFQNEVRTLIPGLFQGLNATVFANGATGSGKTYTMQGREGEPGLIPLAMSTIISLCENASCSVDISYYEVYMDRCYDLLEPKAKEIMTLDDKDGKLQLKGLSWVPVRSMDEFSEFFSTAIQRRKVAHTVLNHVSSRSHGVLAVVVTNCGIKGKLNLIDLAGNEDNRRTCNEGIRLQESAKINQSLFALSNVIYALNNNEPRIPYRESKLTRILQDSLGGTSRALMISCLNPASYQEAIHTVSLAARSRQIVNYVGSANKKEAPREKVDMEAKLKTWLESKGKTKSVQRRNGPFSPSVGKTPTSVSSSRNLGINQSVEVKTTDHVVFNTKGRKLFDSGTVLEDNILSSSTTTVAVSQSNEETRSCEGVGVTEAQNDSVLDDFSFIVKNDHYQDTHDVHDQLGSSEIAVSCVGGILREQDGTFMSKSPSISKNENPEKDMTSLNFNKQLEISKVGDDSQHKIYGEKQVNTSDASISNLSDLPVTPFNKENLHSPSTDYERSLTLRQTIKPLQNSLREMKVFSPISSNMTPISFEPKTPKTPYVITCDKDEAGLTRTPLDKFNASSFNLKESLVEEYLTFLNVASKEELLQLKGIGQRRAEYIVELREDSPNPLKSLSDLEKIGLSSRQVHDMFKRMAREIFT